MKFSHRALVAILSFFSFDLRNTKLKSNAQPRPSKKNVEWNDALVLSASYGKITSSVRLLEQHENIAKKYMPVKKLCPELYFKVLTEGN